MNRHGKEAMRGWNRFERDSFETEADYAAYIADGGMPIIHNGRPPEAIGRTLLRALGRPQQASPSVQPTPRAQATISRSSALAAARRTRR